MTSKTTLRQYLEKVTDARLLQKTPLAMLVAVTTTVHLVSSIDLAFSNFEIRIPLAVMSMIPAVILLYLGHYVAKKLNKLKVAIIFLAYLVGGLIRGWILETGLYEFEILSKGATNFRISTGALIVTVCASVVSYFWSTVSEARATIISLRNETLSLQETLDNLAKEVEASDVQRSLNVFKKLTNELGSMTENSVDVQKSVLEELVNGVVRPLSRSYAPKRILTSINPVASPKITPQGVWKLFDPLRHLPSFRITVFFLALTAAVPVRRLYGWGAAIELGLIVMFSLSISLFLINPIAKQTLDRFKSPLREIVMTFGFILLAIPPSISTTIALRNTPNPDAYLIPGLITLPLFAWILTIGNAAWEYSQKIRTDLKNTRNQIQWALARLNLLSWYKNGLISRLLHGPIQNSLQVAIMQIRAADEEGKNLTVIQQVIERINEAITGSLDDNRSAKNDLIEMKKALSTWGSVAKIEISSDKFSEDKLLADSAGCAIFADIVIEACSNSIRHGGSTVIKISYRKTDAGIQMKLIDNGSWDEAQNNSGLGSELISSCAVWTNRNKFDGWNELTLELPLGNQPPENFAANQLADVFS